MRNVNAELEYLIAEPRKEFLIMVIFVVGNIPLMYLLNKAPQGGNSYGYASACAYVITIMIVVISIFVNKFSEEKETGRRKYGK